MSSAQATWPSRVGQKERGEAAALGGISSSTVVLYLVVALLAGAYLLPFMHVFSGAPDEGLYLYASQRAAEGAIPGRDFVQENPPGAYYWLALFFRVFGTNLTTARTVLFFTGISTVLVVFHLARRAGGRGISAAAFVLVTSIPLMPINSPHYDSNLFALIAFAVFLAGVESMSRDRQASWAFLVAGGLAGWVSCILQQKGFLFLAAFAITLFALYRKRAIRPIVAMGVSYTCVLIAELVPYAVWGALHDLFLATVKMPLSTYQGLNSVMYGFPLWTVWFPTLFTQLRANAPIWVALPLLLATSIPFLCIVAFPPMVAILGYLWRPNAFSRNLLPFWIVGYAMWLSELHRRDLSHLRNGCILLAVLFLALCELCGGDLFKRIALGITLGTLLMGTTTLNGALHAHQRIISRRGNLVGTQANPILQELISRTKPGDYAFVYPYLPSYYFLADVRNPTRFNAIVDQRKRNPLIQEAVRDLESKQPRYVVVDTTLLGEGMRTMFPALHVPPPEDRAIDSYVAAHYHLVKADDTGNQLLERNAGQP